MVWIKQWALIGHNNLDNPHRIGYNQIEELIIMSTRELAYKIVDSLDDKQLAAFVDFFSSMFYEIPNKETLAAMEEADRMLADPSTRRFGSVDELFEDLNS